MNHPYRLIRPEELAAPGEMEPAVVLRVSLKAIANVVAEKLGKTGAILIFHASDSDAMYLRIDDVPLAFVSFNEEPREVHVYVADRNVQGEIDFSLPSERVIRALRQIIGWRGRPQAIRCDNGPEYLSAAITEWGRQYGIRLDYIQPGKPQQNAYVERFNRTVRYEWLSQYHWEDLDHVQRVATDWMWTYNHDRPNMALGGFTPKQRLAMAA
ncbi:transposase [Trinickia fusca]|uniref:Transposase n=1 Tax=Trinickia fusca TaxID=2419777 RepID=A0A494X5K7_9BURK|nr:transposase [Trinickia fusca]